MGIKNLLLALTLLASAASAAPLDFQPAYNVLYGVQTKHITSTVDGQKYSWFKADIRFGDGSIMRYCVLMDMNKIHELPRIPNLRQVNGFYTNATTIDPVDNEWCLQ